MKIIETHWFNATNRTIGLIIAEDETTGKINGYIGVGKGFDEISDEEHIIAWGNKIEDPMVAKIYIKALGKINKRLEGLVSSK